MTGVYIISSHLRRVCIISMMDDTEPPRSSLSSRKEGAASPHWASGSWNGSPRYLGGLGQPPTRFLSVVFPQGVQGVPWRRRARLPASDPLGKTCRNFATCRTTSSTGCWTNGSMAGNPANASSVRSTRLSRQPATSKMMLVLVHSGRPRSCLMAHSDRGHPPPFPVPRTRCPGLP